jgi:hypothetical protein
MHQSAFEGCSSLQSVCLPPSLAYMSWSCFNRCGKLSSIVLEAGSRLDAETVSALRRICAVTLK